MEQLEISPLKLLPPPPTCKELAPAETFDDSEHSPEKTGDAAEECAGAKGDAGPDEEPRAGEREEPTAEETTEQTLHNIAKELLQTERAYVARLHLLDQVSAVALTRARPPRLHGGHGSARTVLPGVLRSADGRSRSRLLPARGDQKHLLQRFLHLLLPQPVPAARPRKLSQMLVRRQTL